MASCVLILCSVVGLLLTEVETEQPSWVTFMEKDGNVRLANGTDSEGRVEVFYDSGWGTLCDDFWDDHDAQVVCRQLGHAGGRAVGGGVFPPAAHGPILLDSLECYGDEDSLAECRHDGWGFNDCTHAEDAGVICGELIEVARLPNNAPPVRLLGGAVAWEGRVEVHDHGEWGTVCDDFWDDTDAGVVCRELGFSDGRSVGEAHFGEGSGPIHLDSVACEGWERHVLSCPEHPSGPPDCSHAEDAGVICV